LRLTRGAALVAGGLLGFVSVTALGGAMASRRAAHRLGATTRAPATSSEPTPVCDRTSRLADLTKMESGLAGRIEELRAADAVARFLPPRDLPPRFAGSAVRSAVEDAIAGSDVAGRVDDVDCSAYPCLVIGHYAHGQEVGRVQRGLRANPAYTDDVALVMAMGADPGGGAETMIGAIVFPRNEPRAAEFLAAFRRRRTEVMERRAAARTTSEPAQ